MTAEHHEHYPVSISPELQNPGILGFEVIKGGGEATAIDSELMVVPGEALSEVEAVEEVTGPELELIIGGLSKAEKKEKIIIAVAEKDTTVSSTKKQSIEEVVAKSKSGSGSSWSICDCGCKREAKFGDCANIGYIRLDRKRA